MKDAYSLLNKENRPPIHLNTTTVTRFHIRQFRICLNAVPKTVARISATQKADMIAKSDIINVNDIFLLQQNDAASDVVAPATTLNPKVRILR